MEGIGGDDGESEEVLVFLSAIFGLNTIRYLAPTYHDAQRRHDLPLSESHVGLIFGLRSLLRRVILQ